MSLYYLYSEHMATLRGVFTTFILNTWQLYEEALLLLF